MFVKQIMLVLIATAVPAGICDDMMVGDAARPDRASQRYVQSLVGPVKARFAALADASRCRQEDNRFSYDLLLSKVSGAGRAILERAALDGVDEGQSISSVAAPAKATSAKPVSAKPVSAKFDSSSKFDSATKPGIDACKAAIDRLRAADDRLLLLAENIPG